MPHTPNTIPEKRPRPSPWNFLKLLRQPSLGRDAILSGLLALMLGTAILLLAVEQLDQQADLAEMVNATGKLRMLSQRIAFTAYLAAEGDESASNKLQLLQQNFSDGLQSIEVTGARLGLFRYAKDDSHALFIELKNEWMRHQILTSPLASPLQTPTPYLKLVELTTASDKLLESADAVVRAVLRQFSQQKQQLRSMLPAALVAGLVLTLLTIVYNYYRIRRPLERIGHMFDQFTSGDLSARIPDGRKDEFGILSDRINRNAETIQHLRAEQALTEIAIHESELRNRTLWEVSTDAIVMIDIHNIIRYTNPAVHQVFGYSQKELMGKDITLLQPERLQAQHQRGFARYIETEKRQLNWSQVELPVLHKSGKEIQVELSFAHMVLSEESWFVGFFRDITQRKEALADLHIRERAIDSTSEGVMITDAQAADHPIIYINPALERITGYCAEDVMGKSGRIFMGKDIGQVGIESLILLLKERREGSVELQGHQKNGTPYWIELSVAPVLNTLGAISHYVSVYKDISERKKQEAALRHSATYDVLTGLPNRSLLYDRIHQAISSGDRYQREVGILFVDLDHFKTVNDSLGHDFGDQLLLAVSKRLQTCLRDGDTASRWGGDEFVILLPDLRLREDIVVVARRILESLNKPIQLAGHEVYCTASVGGSMYPKDGKTTDELLKHADVAMYRAKESGRNTYRLYAEDMQHGIDRRLQLEGQLRKAIQNGELSLHFQPKIEIKSGKVIGAEALIRWRHPEHGLVSPALFIPIAEETGLILAIDNWVLQEACHELRLWRNIGLKDISIAINLSSRQFTQSDLPQRIHAAVDNHGLLPADLELEITEGMLMHNASRAIETLQDLKSRGFSVAIDDFGTGYSSLAYLKNFPVETLKIDKSFVQDKEIVRAIIQLAVSYKLKIVAEGVEDSQTADMLDALGCDIIQGYFYSRPLPSDQFIQYVQKQAEIRE